MYQKELMLIKPMVCVSVLFVIRFHPNLFDGCHELMQKAISFNDVAIVSVKGNDYRTHFLVYE